MDLTKDRRLLLIMNAAGLGLFLLSAWLFSWLVVSIRPNLANRALSFSSGNLSGLFWLLVWILAITGATLLVHEAIHGIFFWIFTASRPRFGFRGYYAFAAAPEWYIARPFYWIVALAPVLLMTLAGVVAIFLVAENMLIGLVFMLTMNFSGSVGDMMTAVWLLPKPAAILVQDSGDRVSYFQPAQPGGN